MYKLDAKKVLQALNFARKDIKNGNSTAAEAQVRLALTEIATYNRQHESTVTIS